MGRKLASFYHLQSATVILLWSGIHNYTTASIDETNEKESRRSAVTYAEEADISAAAKLDGTNVASLVAPVQHAVCQVLLVIPAHRQQQCSLLILYILLSHGFVCLWSHLY